MLVSNTSLCYPSTLQTLPYEYSCGVPILSAGNTTANNTQLLQSCCPSSSIVTPYGDLTGGKGQNCYVYCNTTNVTNTESTQYCLGNTTIHQGKNFSFGVWGCRYPNNGDRVVAFGKFGWIFSMGIMGLVCLGSF